MSKDNYFDFLEKCLPTFRMSDLEDPKKLVNQFDFKNDGKFVTNKTIEYLAQGDIFNNLPYVYFNKEKNMFETKLITGILLSNTCDSERREYLSFAPMLPIDKITRGNLKESTIKKNEKNSLLYLPYNNLSNQVFDLNRIFSLPRDTINNLLENKKINKEYSLMQIGHYLLITKLIVLFCRTESADVEREK